MNNTGPVTANINKIRDERAANQAAREEAQAQIADLQQQLEECQNEAKRLQDDYDTWKAEQEQNPELIEAQNQAKEYEQELENLKNDPICQGRSPEDQIAYLKSQEDYWQNEWQKKADEWFTSEEDKQEMERYERGRVMYMNKRLDLQRRLKEVKTKEPTIGQQAIIDTFNYDDREKQTTIKDQNAACNGIAAQIADLTNRLDDFDAIDETLNEKEQFWKENFSEKDDKYNINAAAFGKGYTYHGDIRNLPGGANFRVHNGMTENYEKNQVQQLSKSYYMNKDFLFTNNLHSPIPLGMVNHANIPEIQPLVINEFQPDVMVSLADLIPKSIDSLGSILKGLMGGAIINIGRQYLTHAAMREAAADPSKLYRSSHEDAGKRFTTDPVVTVRNMFMGGKWLNTFEIPYYGSNYLQADYKSNWRVGGADGEGGLGKTIGGIAKSFGIDYPGNPRFEVSMESSANRMLKTSFYLINSNDNWLKKNFKFLHAFFAGTSWVHLNFCMVRPSNVYNVLCPGRFNLMWATMGVTITTVGKLRYNVEVSNELSQFSKAIDKETLWPDAWKVVVDIKELSPNNFNMYADYYLNGFNMDEIAMQEQSSDLLDMLSQIKDYLAEKINEIVKAGKEEGQQVDMSKFTSDLKEKSQEATSKEDQNNDNNGAQQ